MKPKEVREEKLHKGRKGKGKYKKRCVKLDQVQIQQLNLFMSVKKKNK